MLEAAVIDRIADLTKEAIHPVMLHCDKDPKHVYRVWNPRTEEIALVEAAPPPRSYTAGSIEDLAGMAAHFKVDDSKPFIVVGPDRAVLMIDEDRSRRHRVTLPLPVSRQRAAILRLERERPWLSQREALAFLRVDLGIGEHEVVGVLRSIRFNRTEDGESTIKTGNESLGASVQARIGAGVGGGDLPDLFRVTVPIFEHVQDSDGDDGPAFEFVMIVETNLAEQKFRFTPRPGDTAAALAEGRGWVRKQIADAIAVKGAAGVVFIGAIDT